MFLFLYPPNEIRPVLFMPFTARYVPAIMNFYFLNPNLNLFFHVQSCNGLVVEFQVQSLIRAKNHLIHNDFMLDRICAEGRTKLCNWNSVISAWAPHKAKTYFL